MTIRKEMIFEEIDVKDFAKWKSVFDSHEEQRKKYGFIRSHVFRSVENPNHVAMIFDIESRDIASQWMESDALKAIRQEAGVIGDIVYGYSS